LPPFETGALSAKKKQKCRLRTAFLWASFEGLFLFGMNWQQASLGHLQVVVFGKTHQKVP
jgi:hypothetical protein